MHRTASETFTTLAIVASLSLAIFGTSCGKNQIPGVKSFNAGVQEKRLFVSFLAIKLHWDYGGSIGIPGLPGSLVSVSPDMTTGGTLFEFSIDTTDLVSDITHGLPSKGLPDGRPLPDVASGVMPTWQLPIHSGMELSLYLSEDAFGIFVPIDLSSIKGIPLLTEISFEIHDQQGNLLGKAYALPSNGGQSGLLALIPYTLK